MQVELDAGAYFKEFIAPRFDDCVHINRNPRFEAEYLNLKAKGGRAIIYSPHQSHSDGWAMAVTVEYLMELAREARVDFPGVVLPIARSMLTGHQGLAVKYLTELSIPILKEKGVLNLPYTRKKDEFKYGLKKNVAEVLGIGRAVRNGYDLSYFPEASVQGGRHKNFLGFVFGGEIYGMGKVDDPDGFLDFYGLMDKFGRVRGEIFFVPVIIEGGNRFFGADLTIPTMELVTSLFQKAQSPIEVNIERPLTTLRIADEMSCAFGSDKERLNDFLMRKLTTKLSPPAQGIYRSLSY